MLYRKLGNSGIEASVVTLGAWAIGGWMWGGTEEQDAIRGIHAAIDNGINMIDTAPIYGMGRSEELVGKAIADRRDKVLIATKCGLRWDLEKGEFRFHADDKGVSEEPAKYKVYKYLGAESIREEVERSLKRLGVDHIDLYQTHRQDATTPIEETMEALVKLKEEGKIRAIGVSNATIDDMKKYGPIDTDQEKFSMLDREMEETGQLQYCIDNNIAFLAYSPLALGLLSGKMGPEREFAEGDLRKNNPRFTKENRQRVQDMLDRFKPLCDKYNATIAQLVIAWSFSQPGVTHVLCGARTEKHAVDNAAAGNLKIAAKDIDFMNETIRKADVAE
ncbi:MAG: aldo/keto reductase [Candidatus Sumerlaeia bacterium]